jgi:hypothetical protein
MLSQVVYYIKSQLPEIMVKIRQHLQRRGVQQGVQLARERGQHALETSNAAIE